MRKNNLKKEKIEKSVEGRKFWNSGSEMDRLVDQWIEAKTGKATTSRDKPFEQRLEYRTPKRIR